MKILSVLIASRTNLFFAESKLSDDIDDIDDIGDIDDIDDIISGNQLFCGNMQAIVNKWLFWATEFIINICLLNVRTEKKMIN